MKKFLAVLLSVVLLLGAFGVCATAEEAAKWDTTKNDEIILSVMNNYYTEGWYNAAKKYMELHPETTVTIDVIANNDALSQKFTTWFASDDLSDASDITHINFGNIRSMQEKGQCYDFSQILDEINPYTGKPVRDCFEEADIKTYTNENGMYALPFDHVGVAMMVNTDMLAEHKLEVPTTMEEWLHCCEVLKADGIDTPILATPEGTWFIAVLADAALRDLTAELIVRPEDGAYDEATMAANATFAYNPDDLTCDRDVVFSGERIAMYETDTQFDTPVIHSVWAEYAKYAPYFNANYMDSSSTEVLTSFEMGEGAFLVSGSWNVGVLNKDMIDLGDSAFNWITIAFPNYAAKPEGWASEKLRSLYAGGNCMGIILTGDEDHTARVVDFYEFVYNPEGCAEMFETTLNADQFVQGPVGIKGVELSKEINDKMAGFIAESSEKGDFSTLVGRERYLSEDSGTYKGYFDQLTTGEITSDEFLDSVRPILLRRLADDIETSGYDLDPATKDTMK